MKLFVDVPMLNATHTESGYEVIDLRYNKNRNIIVGRVKDPIFGNPKLHNGFVTGLWTRHGKSLDKTRQDFNLVVQK